MSFMDSSVLESNTLKISPRGLWIFSKASDLTFGNILKSIQLTLTKDRFYWSLLFHPLLQGVLHRVIHPPLQGVLHTKKEYLKLRV